MAASVEEAKKVVQIYEGVVASAQKDLTAQQNVQTVFQNKANTLKDKAAGLPDGSPEQQAALESAANYQTQADNQKSRITAAQSNLDSAQANLGAANQDLVDTQQRENQASSQTAGDSVANSNSNVPAATQNTGTQSSAQVTEQPTGSTSSSTTNTSAAGTPASGASTSGSASGSGTAPAPATAPTVTQNQSNKVTDAESKNLTNSNPSNSQPDAVVVGGSLWPAYSGAGGGRGSTAAYAKYDVAAAVKAADLPSVKKTTQVGGPASKQTVAKTNPLSSYASYTYAISLHVMTKDDYNKMVKSPVNFRPTKTLISSANRYNGSTRDAAFKDDFYFDGLSINTVIGLNANTRSTNAIAMKFTIIEPYGMTLLDRILDINNKELNSKNYLDMPYLLELNFFGADDAGKMTQLKNQTKWFPIKIIGFKIRASVKGAEYQIDAVPFNHQANFETIQALKTRFEISAGTVKEYFSSQPADSKVTNNSVNAAIKQYKANEDAVRKQNSNPAPEAAKPTFNTTAGGAATGNPNATKKYNGARTPDSAKSADAAVKPVPPVTSSSFTAAYNTWNIVEKSNGNLGFADEIQFIIDPEIESSTIVDRKTNSVRRSAPVSAADSSKSKNANSDVVNLKSIVHSLDPGTTVNDVINLVMQQSKWFIDQTIDPATKAKETNTQATTTTANKTKPTVLWKTIPSIELKDYDEFQNSWGKIITFHIKKYAAYNNRDPRAPKSAPPAAVKNYEYFYTGHNTDIIDFDIDFNALYYTAINVDRGKTSTVNGPSQTNDEGKLKEKLDHAVTKGIDPQAYRVVSGTQQTAAGGAIDTSAKQNAASVVQSFYTSAGGDMISLKLKIVGDPEFIKQDDLFYNPGALGNNASDQYVAGSGSLAMDNGEIYCNLTFKTPTDFDDSTGKYLTTGKYRVSEFSGYYKVITVTSEFKSGKFIQTLDLVRYPNQEPKNSQNKQTTSTVDPNREKAKPVANSATTSTRISNNDVAKPVDVVPAVGTNLFAGQVPKAADEPAKKAPEPAPETPTANQVNEARKVGIAAGAPALQTTADVVSSGETKSIDQATSADANTTPVQSTNVPAVTAAANAEEAKTQITALANTNTDLQAQNEKLRQQNAILQRQGNLDQVFANQDIIAKNNATQAANGSKAEALATKYKLELSTITSDLDGTVIKLG